jgi:hypothetical protein
MVCVVVCGDEKPAKPLSKTEDKKDKVGELWQAQVVVFVSELGGAYWPALVRCWSALQYQ